MKPSRISYFTLLISLSAGIALLAYYLSKRSGSNRLKVASVELHLTNLVQHAGQWCPKGQTNPFTGVLLDTYADGVLKSRSTVTNGRLEGISLGYYTNGQMQVEEHYTAGTSDGLRTKWHLNGQKLSEVNVVKGKLQGVFRRWDEQGALTEEMPLRDGQGEGLARAYYSSGFIKAEAQLKAGKVVDQHSWKDGERPGPGSAASGSAGAQPPAKRP